MLICLCYFRTDLNRIEKNHSKDNFYSKALIHNESILKSLNNKLPKNTVLFNVKADQFIEAMFYTGFPSYDLIPTFEQYNEMIKKGMTIAIFKYKDIELPSYLTDDKDIIIIYEEIIKL